jgi:hypothetical protein
MHAATYVHTIRELCYVGATEDLSVSYIYMLGIVVATVKVAR